LLLEREPIASISHKKMPTYEKHVKFVMSNPYARWYIVNHKNNKIGSVYLSKQNEIGIFLKKGEQDKGIGSIVLQLIIEKNGSGRYLANISPRNKKSIKFFKKHGFNLIQYTYEFIKK
jgi:RimJ/RimL family protein N-acetyltransferase